MTIKTIIMPLASNDLAKERLEGALNVARYFRAHLDVLHAKINPRQLLPEENQLISNEFYKRIDQIVSEYVNEDFESVRGAFNDICARLNVNQQDATPSGENTTALWHDLPGFRGEVVAEKGKLSDLIVVPQPRRAKSSVSFEAAILHSGKPVLVMPRSQAQFAPKNIVIAWNGDTQAARAVTAAMPILKRAEKVTILTSERSESKRPTQSDLREYLALHNINSECEVFKSGRVRIPQALLETATQLDADLIVCGAYAHQRIHQQMFGDVTKTLLRKSALPLLMIG